MPEHVITPPLYAPRYWPVWIGFGLFRLFALLPWPWMMAIGRALGRQVMRLAPRRVRIARINLQLCFPELDEIGLQDLLRAHFEALGMGLMDIGLAWWASDKRLAPRVRVHGAEHAVAAFCAGNGVIFLTAHFSSVEMSGRILKQHAPVLPMYRPNENPAIESLMVRNRQRHVERAIPREDVRLMLRTLKSNKGVWFAPDQNFGHKNSLFSPFFGVPAATNTATSRFARMTGARVVPFVAIRREDNAGYDLYIEPALEDFPSADPQRDTDRVNAIMERWIRQAPAQYLWTHRRFKDRPGDEPRFY
jgi:KDO2-lipid IV(A) lauroyltransferase